MATVECARCETTFDHSTPHTELVRRDFLETPRPSRVEYLCPKCWRAYVEEFLGEAFEYDDRVAAE